MNRKELTEEVDRVLSELVGEQFDRRLNPNTGDTCFSLFFQGVPVGLSVERLGESESVLAGHHVVGTMVEDKAAAARWVAHRNQNIRQGRLMLIDDDVVFFHHLLPPISKDSVRIQLSLLAGEARCLPDLAEQAGALSVVDAAALNGLEDE